MQTLFTIAWTTQLPLTNSHNSERQGAIFSLMHRNWRDLDGPNFRYHPNVLAEREAEFLRQCGVVVATVRHVPDDERLSLVIEWISTEALKISEIEEDILARDSVRSSLRRQFGLQGDGPPRCTCGAGNRREGAGAGRRTTESDRAIALDPPPPQ